MDTFNEFALRYGDGSVPIYQLYWEDVLPRRYFLGVNGDEPQLIESRDLSYQSGFRNWLFDHGYMPPETEKDVHKFERFIEHLWNCKTERETPAPFLDTDAEHIEDLASYFEMHVHSDYRRGGPDYLDGNVGQSVRFIADTQRLYFKWQPLKRFMVRSLNARPGDIKDMKLFIMAKGGYQGEEGARDWLRWTYYVPLNLFDEPTKARWFRVED
jgi:hypothetical protein